MNQNVEVYLNCTAEGLPNPNISWSRLSDNSIVTIPLYITGRKDQGGYRCKAYNGIGDPDTADVFITVQSKSNSILGLDFQSFSVSLIIFRERRIIIVVLLINPCELGRSGGPCMEGAGRTSPRSEVKIAVFGITQSFRGESHFFSSKISFSALHREKLKPRLPRLVYFSGPIPVFRGASPCLLRGSSPGLNNYRKRKITHKTRPILRCWLPICIFIVFSC